MSKYAADEIWMCDSREHDNAYAGMGRRLERHMDGQKGKRTCLWFRARQKSTEPVQSHPAATAEAAAAAVKSINTRETTLHVRMQ